jgi:predicted TIM-barrel fold metal-dependent hydrolase
MDRVIIDSDGHVTERDEELIDYLPAPFTSNRRLFSHYFFTLSDKFHRGAESILDNRKEEENKAENPRPDVNKWRGLLDESGIKWAALYPGRGLTINTHRSPEWGGALAQGYNNWLHDQFTAQEPRLKGVALLHLYDIPAAVAELRRCVESYGFDGAVLMTSGLPRPLGHPMYFPLYEEAERLDVAVAVHAASSNAMGLADGASALWEVRAMSHGAGQIISFLSMVNGGVFDAFPNLRVGYLESGCGWVPYLVDRMDRIYHGRGARLSKKMKRSPTDVLRSGQVFVHAELDERMLPVVARLAERDDIFMFASDFPHEPWSVMRREVDHFQNRDDLADSLIDGMLAGAARRFYQLDDQGNRVGRQARAAGTAAAGRS